MSDKLTEDKKALNELCDEIIHNYNLEPATTTEAQAIQIIKMMQAMKYEAEEVARKAQNEKAKLERLVNEGKRDSFALEESRRCFDAVLSSMERALRDNR